jgi:hypothetical protein
VTAQPLASRSTLTMRLRELVAGASPEALVLAGGVPFLFLHATYQPHLSIPARGTSIDVTLADAAIAAVSIAALVRSRREGLGPLRAARWVLAATAAFVVICLLALATPSVLGESYGFIRHAISALKLGWYALLLPGSVLILRTRADSVVFFRAMVLWSSVATTVGLLQFLGLVSEFEGKRPGQREPSIVGIQDFAALSGAALTLGIVALLLADGRPLGAGEGVGTNGRRAWTAAALVTGALGVVLSGAMSAVAGLWLSVAALLLLVRARSALSARRALVAVSIALVVTAGTSLMRGQALERFAHFLGSNTKETQVQSYAHRTLLAYIGARIWLGHPVTGVGYQASSEEWAYGPYLADAHRRFPSEPAEAFPSPAHPWGVQSLYLEALADLGVIGFAALVAVFASALVAGARGWLRTRRRADGSASPHGSETSVVPLVGLAWLFVVVGIWAGIGLVPGIPLAALTFLALGLVTVDG